MLWARTKRAFALDATHRGRGRWHKVMSGRRRLLLASLVLAVILDFVWAAWPQDTNPIVATIRAPLDPRQPVAIGVDAATRRAFVVGAGLLYTLDLDRDTLARTTRTSNTMDNPSMSPTLAILTVDAWVGHVFVANAANGTVSMLDA